MSYTRRKKKRLLDYNLLEKRQLLAVSVSLDAEGELSIQGDGSANLVTVSQPSAGQMIEVDVAGHDPYQFDSNLVSRLYFHGGNGDDLFDNQTDLPADARGHNGNDTLSSGLGDDLLIGGPGADILSVKGGANQLMGGDGDDLINGGSGYDYVLGGYGDDTIHGGKGNDLLRGGWDNDTIYGELGDDVIHGYTGTDVIYGSAGNDKLYGQADSDLIYGGGGDDIVRGGKSDDELHGDDGNDFILGDKGNDELHGGLGIDVMYGSDGDDYMRGGGGDDLLYGQNGNDDIAGGDGNDLLRGGNDDDFLQGMDGNDRLDADAGNDIGFGGAGDDTLLGDEGDDQLDGQSGADLIYGNAGDDLLRGGANDDILWGGNGSDSLFGGNSDDFDRLWGQGDDDRFLVQGFDQVRDETSVDAVLVFQDVSSQWSNKEIEVLDQGFAQLHQRTQNTRLLKDTLPTGRLTFYKESMSQMGNALAVNSLQWTSNPWSTTYARQIKIREWSENSESNNDLMQSTVIHEIAHNWDSELELTTVNGSWSGRWNNFQGLSGWTTSPIFTQNYVPSLNGQWWYLSNASFAASYGQTTPNEDMATVWQYVFSGQSTNDPGLQSKLDHVNALFDDLI